MFPYRKVLVTGASSGLGVEFSRQIAQKGADLVLVARRADRLEALAAEIRGMGRSARVVVADLFDSQARAMLGNVMKEEGVDLLINNAGFGFSGQFVASSFKTTSEMVELNVQALVELSHCAVAHFEAQGKPAGIINIASTAAFAPIPYFSVYAATKSFVLSFSTALAHEVKHKSIRVAAVCPGPTQTEFFVHAGANAENIKKSPLGLMTARDCVAIALRKFECGKIVIPTGFMNSLFRILSALLPNSILAPAAGKLMRDLR